MKMNLIRAALLVAGATLMVGCSGDFLDTQTDTFGEEFRDVRVGARNDDPAVLIQMPNTYSNVAFKCHGLTGVYVTRNAAPSGVSPGRAVAVAPNDPNCAGEGGQ